MYVSVAWKWLDFLFQLVFMTLCGSPVEDSGLEGLFFFFHFCLFSLIQAMKSPEVFILGAGGPVFKKWQSMQAAYVFDGQTKTTWKGWIF